LPLEGKIIFLKFPPSKVFKTANAQSQTENENKKITQIHHDLKGKKAS
jgi:hypothetical protein